MIQIEKSQRTLKLIRNGETLFCCRIMLGENPIGPKEREGDGKTPEGCYRICSVNRQSKFHISLGINYPSKKDALQARHDKKIGLFDFIKICAADALHLRPAWTSPLGGFIMIHGESPEGKTGDWTKGCVALGDADIEKLASFCKRGEQVIILP